MKEVSFIKSYTTKEKCEEEKETKPYPFIGAVENDGIIEEIYLKGDKN